MSARTILSSQPAATLLFVAAVFLVAVATRVAHLGAPPFYDEFYHLLAAESWQKDGSFTVYEGEYARAPWYTIMTAWMFDLAGGPNVIAARAPNVVLGALLAAGSALWARQVAGRGAGWIVAAFVILWPSGIHLSQVVRFYALHGLLFFIAACAVYDLFLPNRTAGRRALLLAIALVALWLANKFQASTLVGALGLGLWAAIFVLLPAILRSPRRGIWLLTGGAAVVAIVVLLLASGTLAEAWSKYNISPWGRDATAYHRVLASQYPLFWTTTPLLAILALRSHPRPARFCLTLVTVGLIVHSFGGVQNIRYIYYFTPFLFTLWAMGLSALFPLLAPLREAATRALGGRAQPRLVSGLLIFVGLFAVFCNDAAVQSAKLAVGAYAPPFQRVTRWNAAQDTVERLARGGAVRVATNELAAIEYLGGFDVVFSKNWMPEMGSGEFVRDPRTGRPFITEVASIGALVQAYPEGVFLAPQSWWSIWPINNSVNALMMAFNVPGVTWSMEKEGPLWILHWTNEVPSSGPEFDRIREIVNLQREPR